VFRNFVIVAVFIILIITSATASESPSIGALKVFPADNPWNWDISTYAVHPNSDNFIKNIGNDICLHPDFGTVWDGAPNGIPYCIVYNTQPLLPVEYTDFGDESDAGPFPVPLEAPVEGGSASNGDRHVIVVDIDNAMLYELYRAFPVAGGWLAASGAKFDLSSNELRPEGWTSADAAGLPIFPGLIRYEEVYIRKQINHAVRFTVENTQRKYIYPARHFASSATNPDLPSMGLRFRLKAAFDISTFSEPVQVILRALKKYGMVVADNGGNWFISGAPDDRWDDDVLGELKTIAGSNFEAVVTVDSSGKPIFPSNTAITYQERGYPDLTIKSYPSPFNSATIIEYTMPQPAEVSLKIYDLAGHHMITLFSGHQSKGTYTSKWIPGDVSSGIYFYVFQSQEFSATGKVLYLK
jgi:hypothetical protein